MQVQESIRFADIEIRPGRRQVLRAGAPLALGSRAFDLLLALAARPGHVLTKDELLDAVWNGAAIGENNLVVQIGTLRKVLGPDLITTLPGRGYQWTGGSPSDAQARRDTTAPAPAPEPLRSAPAAAPDLVGRDAEFAWLQRALAARPPGGVVSIVGGPGIGKTALARALGASLQHMRLNGLPCTVELAALPALPQPVASASHTAALAVAVADALGLRIGARRAPLDALAQQLAHRAAGAALPPLLVLDNGEHVHAALRKVVGALAAAAPALPLLVTSQLPLHLPGEQVLRLSPLDLPGQTDLQTAWASGAVALFCLRAVEADAGFELDARNVSAVVDICRRLDGVPLALELAAGRLVLLGPDGLRKHLDERLQLLRGPRNGPRTRHSTLAAALDWSYRLLLPSEQAVLRRLAVFAGSFSTASAQAVAQDAALDAWAVMDALGALLDRSLVSPQPAAAGPDGTRREPRFVLLESVRVFARQQLQANGEAVAVGRRHAEHFLALAEAHGGGLLAGDAAAARRLQVATELDNLRAAMAWCIEHDARLGLRLAAALALLWREAGLLTEGRQACAAVLERTADDPTSATRLAVQVTLGALAMEQDDAAQMRAMGQQVLQASRAAGDRRREAHAHGLLAHAAAAGNDMASARAHFEQCLEIYRAMDEPRTIAETLNNLAQCRLAEGRCDLALALVHEALPLARASGHAWTEAAVLQTTGDVRHALGDLPQAEAPLVESLRLRRAHGHAQQVVMSLQSLALLALQRGQAEQARGQLIEATGACALHGFGHLDGLCLLGAAAWGVAAGRAGEAGPLVAAARVHLQDTPVGNRPHVRRLLDQACALAPAPAGAARPCGEAALAQALALLKGGPLAQAGGARS